MCSGVKRKLSNTGHAIGTVNLATVSTRLKAVGLNKRLLSGVLTPQSSELTALLLPGWCVSSGGGSDSIYVLAGMRNHCLLAKVGVVLS